MRIGLRAPLKSSAETRSCVTLQRPPPEIRIFAPILRADSSTTMRAARLRTAPRAASSAAKIALARPAAPAPTMATSATSTTSATSPTSPSSAVGCLGRAVASLAVAPLSVPSSAARASRRTPPGPRLKSSVPNTLRDALARHPPADLVGLVGRGEHDAAALAHGERRVLADLRRELLRRRQRLALLAERVHPAEVVGALGREIEPSGERQLHRDVARQLARQAEQPARGGDQIALDLGDAEHRGARRDQQIARERDLGAAGERGSVDRGDDRLRVLARARCRRSRRARCSCRPGRCSSASGRRRRRRCSPWRSWRRSGCRPRPRRRPPCGRWPSSMPLRDGGVDRVAGLGAVDGDDGEISLLFVVDHRAGFTLWRRCRHAGG